MTSQADERAGPAEAAPPPVNLDDYERLARARLARAAYDFIAGGADDERTLARNRAAFGRFLLRPRALAGIAEPVLATSVLGQPVAFPILLAPTAFPRLAHDEGDRAAARAAGALGTVFVASTPATYSLEDIAAVATGPLWFQLYAYRDRRLTEALVRRAARAGYRALCLTVDVAALGRRERDIRNQFALPPGLGWANFAGGVGADMPAVPGDSAIAAYIAEQLDLTLAWRDLAWLRSLSDLPLIVKGVMGAEDAQQAAEAGAAAVVVSNHGGRQLDGAPATIEVLEEVVAAIGGRCEVYLDGGIRRGTDVLTALALGARAVLIGRPYVWGLAVDGAAGVEDVLRLLIAELRTALILCGCPSVAAVDRHLVMPAPALPRDP